MFEKIEYQLPYFNSPFTLRLAFEKLYPHYSYDEISSVMIGSMSAYIPEEIFNRLISQTLSEATAKINNN